MFHVDGRRYPHDADNKAVIYVDDGGREWVTHEDLLQCGYRAIEDFDVVYLNKRFYELQAHIRRPNAWWIEEVDTETEEEAEQASATPESEQA